MAELDWRDDAEDCTRLILADEGYGPVDVEHLESWAEISDEHHDHTPWPISGDQLTKSRMDAVHESRSSRRG